MPWLFSIVSVSSELHPLIWFSIPLVHGQFSFNTSETLGEYSIYRGVLDILSPLCCFVFRFFYNGIFYSQWPYLVMFHTTFGCYCGVTVICFKLKDIINWSDLGKSLFSGHIFSPLCSNVINSMLVVKGYVVTLIQFIGQM